MGMAAAGDCSSAVARLEKSVKAGRSPFNQVQ
jgi:hypothetical protein